MTPPRANSAAARDIAYVLHPYTDLKAHLEAGPMVISRGEGVRVWDETGKSYIESVGRAVVREPRLLERAAGGGGGGAVAQAALLPRLHRQIARADDRPGGDADRARAGADEPGVLRQFRLARRTTAAIKMVWYFNNALGRPKKKKIIGRIKGYHGITLAAASLTGLPANHRSFDVPLPGFLHTVCPHFYHGGQRRARPRSSSPAAAPRSWRS